MGLFRGEMGYLEVIIGCLEVLMGRLPDAESVVRCAQAGENSLR